MTDAHLLTWLTIAVATLLWIVAVPLPRIRRERYRSDVRRIRDRLFDYMWQNGHSYQTTAYIEVRQLLNGILRCSNTISPPMYVVAAFRMADSANSRSSIEKHISQCDPQLRIALRDARRDAVYRTMDFLFREGNMRLIVEPVRLAGRVFGFTKALQQKAARMGNAIASCAYSLGAATSRPAAHC